MTERASNDPTPADLARLAEEVAAGLRPDSDTLYRLAALPDDRVLELAAGAGVIRRRFFGNRVRLCTIVNGKSGRCSEDCAFCAQSGFHHTGAPVYPLKSPEELVEAARRVAETPVGRYSIVTTGRGLPPAEVARLAEDYAAMPREGLNYCASLGILGPEDMARLRAAGVTRYHHNLETAESHFSRICTTHSFQERVDTIRAAKAAGMSVCSGGIFGLGETDAQVVELALTLRDLDVDAVPVNFLMPVAGTPMADMPAIRPWRCLKIIALLRYALPRADIIVAGGREARLGPLAGLVFHAGATGAITGNYLTTSGRRLEDDVALLADLDLVAERT